MATIQERYEDRHRRSEQLYQNAAKTFPSGVTHDIRYVPPFPIFVERAQDSHKWDADGNEIVDYVMGHGALFLGHSHPAMVRAVTEQVTRGTHLGANHELELRWGELVTQIVPSAEKLRFTGSGTEAVMLALRIARAYTRRNKIIRFDLHFHGWHDAVVGARFTEQYGPKAIGVPPSVSADVISIPAGDIEILERALADEDVAAVILEPTGASWGTVPLTDHFLIDLREATRKYDALLIFDEVITGFRVTPGGAQQHYGITPDLTCLAKILGGGLPGGAVAGRADIINAMEFSQDPEWNASFRVGHPGTFNANPLSSAAGCAMLELIADGRMHQHADTLNQRLVSGMNDILARRDAPGCSYGLASYFHITLGSQCPRPADGIEWPDTAGRPPRMKGDQSLALKQGMLNHGVDLMGRAGGFVSGVHTDEDVERTLEAFEAVIDEMQGEGLLAGK